MSNNKKEVGPNEGIINHPFSNFVAYFPYGDLLNIYSIYSTLLYSTLLYSTLVYMPFIFISSIKYCVASNSVRERLNDSSFNLKAWIKNFRGKIF